MSSVLSSTFFGRDLRSHFHRHASSKTSFLLAPLFFNIFLTFTMTGEEDERENKEILVDKDKHLGCFDIFFKKDSQSYLERRDRGFPVQLAKARQAKI